ncbi:unnamed protein product [Adineta steineri]|uniref:ADP ribosyltransferase domain-containing protein n=1 Tax=Adineta steineri TaxID=433720 RepID=A0A815JU64_9BILA|nr:unnamed protein product [Adineta steineri]CAF1386702.1 unnamed protein product [Adineta steineri]
MELIPLLETSIESISKRNDNHLESFSLIWLNNNENVDIQKELRNIINHIETFHDVEECKDYIEKTSENDRLVLVTNGEFGQQIIPSIHQLRQISSIYINSEDKQWTNDFPKVKGIHVKMDELVSQIHEDHKNLRKIEEPVWMNMFTTIRDAGKSTTGINGQFAFSQLLLDCLLRLKSNENDRNELISCCEKREYEGNQNELNRLHEFQRSYSSDNVLWWYTRESFFYKTLNAALRKQNIHMIYLYRSFISDIQNQLQNHQCQYATRVYRSQLMSIDELNYLKNSVGQYVSVNSFLSTSFEKEIASFYLGDTNHRWIDFEKVLFEIDADPKVVTTKPFADISQFSDFSDESEVLFMLGSIFRLNSIIRDDQNQIWIIEMCLCSDDEHNLKQILMDMKNEIGNGETNLCILGKVVRRMGHLDLAKKYYYRCLEELSQNDPLLLTVYKDLAKIASQEKDYEENLRLRHILAKIKEKIKLNDNEIETSEIDKLTYNNTVQKRKSKNYIRSNWQLKLLICSFILILMIGTGIFTIRYMITKKSSISSEKRTPTCTDGIKNQDETDVDCGGVTCWLKCLPEQGCASSSDCACKPNYNKWKQNAITVAGGNGKGQELNQLYSPYGIFIDKNKNIFVADFENHRVIEWKYNAKQGQIIADKNNRENRTSQLGTPTDVIVDQQNHSIIIADYMDKQVIQWLDQNLEIRIHNINCFGLAMDKHGFLYVSNWAKNEVRRWKMGEYDKGIIVAGGNGQGDQLYQLNSPTYIFVDEHQSVYVVDRDNHRVVKWRKDAKEGTIVAGGNRQGRNLNQLSSPAGVIVDDLGQIYVADSRNNRVMRWCEGKEEGEIVVGGNGEGNQSNQLNYPRDLSFDNERNLYVADEWNHRIQKFEIIL